MGTVALLTRKWQNLDPGPLDFERDAGFDDMPFEGWNLSPTSVSLFIEQLAHARRLRRMQIPWILVIGQHTTHHRQHQPPTKIRECPLNFFECLLREIEIDIWLNHRI